MPEPGTKPSPTKLVSLVATAAGVVALLLLWLILRPPSSQYHTIITVIAVGSVITGGVLILASLVRLVEYRFARRYDAVEAAQREHRQFVQKQLALIATRHEEIGAALAAITASIDQIGERMQSNCNHIRATKTQVARCMSEIGIVGDSIDELREAFVEEGLPGKLGHLTGTGPERNNGAAGGTCRAAYVLTSHRAPYCPLRRKQIRLRGWHIPRTP